MEADPRTSKSRHVIEVRMEKRVQRKSENVKEESKEETE